MKRLFNRYIKLPALLLLLFLPTGATAVEKVNVNSKGSITMTLKKPQSLSVQGVAIQNARSASVVSSRNQAVKAFTTKVSCKAPAREGGKGSCAVKLMITKAVPLGKYTLNLLDGKRQVLAAGQFEVKADPAAARASAAKTQQAVARQKADAARAPAAKKQQIEVERRAAAAARQKEAADQRRLLTKPKADAARAISREKPVESKRDVRIAEQKAAADQRKTLLAQQKDAVIPDKARIAKMTREAALTASKANVADPKMRQRVVQLSSDKKARQVSRENLTVTLRSKIFSAEGLLIQDSGGFERIDPSRQITAPDGMPVIVGNPSQAVTIYDYKINDGSGLTESRNVVLYHKTTNNPTYYRVAESSSWAQIPWIPYTPTPAYTLSQNEGIKTIYLQVKGQDLTDRFGGSQPNVVTVSESVRYYREPLVVSNFRIENEAVNVSTRQVALTWDVSGAAEEFRISESSSMEGTPWIPGGVPPAAGLVFDLQEGAAGPRTLYLQVKGYNSELVSNDVNINVSVGICPVGHRNLECSGAGVCSVSGQCACDIDLSGSACKSITQRCYGAMGTNCAPNDGVRDPSGIAGFCLGETCRITVGSWIHDECCVRHRKGTPNPVEGQSCSINGDVCQAEFSKALSDMGRGFIWARYVNHQLERTTDSDTLKVNFNAMCAPAQAAIACTDSKYCCSRSVNGNSLVGCRCQ